jgi:iron complex outermembrane receptor protein
MRLNSKTVLCATSAVLLAHAAPAFAQRAPQGGTAVGEIIVTARRVEERLQDVPISITVYNQQQLSNRNVVNAQDLATYTPSLSANQNFGAQNSAFAIRGFTQEIGTQPSVGVYFADVVAPRGAANNIPIGDGAGPGDFFDLQNVQVLKGPQGTLFGRNTTGGAILIVPQKPTDKLEGYIEGSYGNYNMKRIQGVINLPLVPTARLRVAVDHESRDGYAKNTTGVAPSRFYDIGYTAARASLVVDVTPNLENYTIGSFLHSSTNGDVQKLVGCLPNSSLPPGGAFLNLLGSLACAQLQREAGTGFYDVQASPSLNPHTTLDVWRIINTTTWHQSDTLTVKNIISYAELREFYKSPIFGTDFNYQDFAAAPFLGITSPTPTFFAASSPIPGTHSAAESTFTEELQLQGRTEDSKLNWQAGVYFESARPLELVGAQSPVLLACNDLASLVCNNPIGAGDVNFTANKTKFRNTGIYGQATYAFNDQWKVTGGIRYTWDKVSNFNILRSYQFARGTAQGPTTGFFCNDPTLKTADCSDNISEKSNKPTWLLDVDYTPTRDLLFYAKWARGYRAGGVQAQAPAQFKTYQPESVDTYEIGAKTTFRGDIHGTFNVAGFYNDFRNQQLLLALNPNQPGLGPASGIQNVGKSRIWGFEVETSIQPFEGFVIDAGYTYLNTELKKVPSGTVCGAYCIVFNGLVGDPLPLSPKNKFTITADYTLPLDESIGRISLGATFTHVDNQLSNYIDKVPTVTIGGGALTVPTPSNVISLATLEARNLLNLNLNWNGIMGRPVDLMVFATNVTDKHYIAYTPGLFQSTQFETAVLGEPRMFGARLKVRFGQ